MPVCGRHPRWLEGQVPPKHQPAVATGVPGEKPRPAAARGVRLRVCVCLLRSIRLSAAIKRRAGPGDKPSG